MTRRRSVATRIRRYGYQVFYRLPRGVRRRVVRLVSPTYTVGSVVLVRDSDGRILLVRQPPGHGWSLPAGMANRGEEPAACAARELAEETGLLVSVADLSPAVPNAVLHSKGRWVDFVFEATVDSDEHTVEVDGAEILEARWCSVQALPPLTVPAARLLAEYGIGPYVGYLDDRAR
ncbi:MAG: NUDIX domain-containing protein [Micromonosporaceae bacterium]|nr:NUDIX domain-containing protein [Micromonosporaceae bacterium]